MNVEEIRNDFPILQKKVNGKPIVYLDSTATSLKPKQVIDAVNYYYNECCANIHRGVHKMSQEASKLYEQAHKKTADFIKAKEEEIIFTRNATESINLVMYSLYNSNYFNEGDEILVSEMEHHANIVPWQFLERKLGVKLNFIKIKEDYTLDLDDFDSKLSERTKLVSLPHASNTIGTINPVKELFKKAKSVNALTLLDAAQSAPHMPVNAKDLNADFIAFSSHKMLGPTGIGVLYGRQELLNDKSPFLFGGEMIGHVEWHSSTWNVIPWKFESGTPAIGEGIGFGAAIDYLQKIGMENIREHEKEIKSYALQQLDSEVGDKITIHNPKDADKQGGIILFDPKKLEAHDVALALDEMENIAIRSGMHCAEPLISRFNNDGLPRASFYIYTTKEEIDLFVETLKKVLSTFG